ncbi:MAG TPA: DUF1508 domain-containing protein [Arthrobacter sp.]|nr:DUF1508 domain-containing protein [Arthrobacter sp.]
MAGTFEVFVDADSLFRFRLISPNGAVIAVSAAFPDKPGVAAGIRDARESAGTGLVTDLCPQAAVARPTVPRSVGPAVVSEACDTRLKVEGRAVDEHAHARPKKLRRAAAIARWTGAA